MFIPHLVINSLDFIKRLPKIISSNSILVLLDVKSLCTSISFDLANKAIRHYLETYKTGTVFPSQLIYQCLEIVMTFNAFSYNDRSYLQILGLAMGTKCAPIVANSSMGYIENYLFKKVAERFGHQTLDFSTKKLLQVSR